MEKLSISQCMAEVFCCNQIDNEKDRYIYDNMSKMWNELSEKSRTDITNNLRTYLQSCIKN